MDITGTTISQRNYGIDLMKVVAMYMICMIHANLLCRAHEVRIPGYDYFFYAGTWTESIGVIGVNLYAMITGYLCLEKQWRPSRYIYLWLMVIFYGIGLILFGLLLDFFRILPWEASGEAAIEVIRQLPFGTSYWYFAAYSGLFFLLPFINPVLKTCSRMQFISLLGVLFVIFPLFNIGNGGCFYGDGYNVAWIISLYTAGAYIRRFRPQYNTLLLILLGGMCSSLPLICRLCNLKAPLGFCFHTTILYTFCVFLLVLKVRISNLHIRKIILAASQATFGVYLIHCHPWFVKLHSDTLSYINQEFDRPWWIAIVAGALVYTCCIPFEYIRTKLFNLIRADEISRAIPALIRQLGRHMCRQGRC